MFGPVVLLDQQQRDGRFADQVPVGWRKDKGFEQRVLMGTGDQQIVFVALDYVTGLIAAWKTRTLDSKKGFEGIKRKVAMLVIVIMAHWIDVGILGISTCRAMVIFAYLGNEGLSIIENLDRMGYGEYIPAFIREKLVQLRSEKESLNDKK